MAIYTLVDEFPTPVQSVAGRWQRRVFKVTSVGGVEDNELNTGFGRVMFAYLQCAENPGRWGLRQNERATAVATNGWIYWVDGGNAGITYITVYGI